SIGDNPHIYQSSCHVLGHNCPVTIIHDCISLLTARMIAFELEDRKYYTCCCGAHITKLARVLSVITLIWYGIQVALKSRLGIAGFLITSIGAMGVFWEMRFPLFAYILMMVVHYLFGILYGAAAVAWLLEYDEDLDLESRELVIPVFIFLSAVAFIILISCIYVYAKLAAFIKYRDEIRPHPGPYPKYAEIPTLQSNREFLIQFKQG
ncbi:hypothetical protein PMAYCL1PPCAC_05668, partial [Pristionchus mayeri]